MRNTKKEFYRIVLERSNENQKALNSLMEQNCYALIGAIIRMELDSLVRVHHFNSSDSQSQVLMLEKFFRNEKWAPHDRKLVDNLKGLLGWAEHIYDFCCAFIHLSPYHDWATNSDIPNLTQEKRALIVKELRAQQNDVWGYPTSLEISTNFSFEDLISFAPYIFKKLKDNLELELKEE